MLWSQTYLIEVAGQALRRFTSLLFCCTGGSAGLRRSFQHPTDRRCHRNSPSVLPDGSAVTSGAMLAHHQGATPFRHIGGWKSQNPKGVKSKDTGMLEGCFFFPIWVKQVQSPVQSSYRNFNNICLYKRNIVCEVHGMPTYNISTLTIY